MLNGLARDLVAHLPASPSLPVSLPVGRLAIDGVTNCPP